LPFSIINDINAGKEVKSPENHNPFIVNRFYSFFPDTLYFAQLMNLNYDLNNRHQISFLINSVRPSKRWQKWLKKEQNADYDAVRDYFRFSDLKTKEALKILTKEQIEVIRNKNKKE